MSARTVKKPEERRSEILDAARALFAKQGYDATSVSDIVKNVGVAHGTFYWYFKSKEEAYHEVVYDYAIRRVAVIEDLARDPELSAVEKIVRTLASFTPTEEWEKDLVNRIHSPTEAALHDRLAREFSRKLIPILADVIRQGVDEGVFETDYPCEAAAFVVAMGSVQNLVDVGELTEAETARWIVAYFDFMAHGIRYDGQLPLNQESPHQFTP